MHVTELLRWRIIRGVAWGLVIRRDLAVSTPHAFIRAGVGIENNDSMVTVTIGDERLVGFRIHGDRRSPEQPARIATVARTTSAADLHEEFPLTRELQDHAVGLKPLRRDSRRAPTEPNVPPMIDGNAVLHGRPIVAIGWATPSVHDIAGAIKGNYRRRSDTAARCGRRTRGAQLAHIQRTRTIDDPNQTLGIDEKPADFPDHPVVGQRQFRPRRVDFVAECLRNLDRQGDRRPDQHGEYETKDFAANGHRILKKTACAASTLRTRQWV